MGRSIVFSMTGAEGVCGGIASTNLNILHALVDVARDSGSALTVMSYLERGEDRPGFLPDWVRFKPFQGRRWAFAAELATTALRRPLLLFDHVTLALPFLPLAVTGYSRPVVFAHGSEAWRYLRRTSRWIFQNARLCLTNSDFTLRKMRERMGEFQGESCPLGLPPQFPLNTEVPPSTGRRSELEAADGSRQGLRDQVLLMVARLDPAEREKGHDALISLLPFLQRDFPDVQLVFPGPGSDANRYRELACARGVGASVFLPGKLPQQDLQLLYRDCYAFVMPSRQEGFGLAYLEAMNYGKPCVGCRDQGAEDVIVHGRTGYLVGGDDSDELRQVIARLLRDPDHSAELGSNGFRRLHRKFTSQHYQQRLKEKIVRLL